MAMNANFYTDCRGERWCDGGGLYQDMAMPCFICGGDTHRLDVNFEAFFCDSQECNERVAYDLKESGCRWNA